MNRNTTLCTKRDAPNFSDGAPQRCDIAFIGLGSMGRGMAANLVKAGFRVKGFDLLQDRIRDFSEIGGIAALDLSDAVSQARIIISSIPGPTEIRALAFDEYGIFKNAPSGAIWVECSTADPSLAQEMEHAGKSRGIMFLDCPVTGGAERSNSATLTMLAGGDAEAYAKVEPVLSAFAKQRHKMGPSGAGYAAKLCQLHLNYVAIAGLSETLSLARGGGVDLAEFSRAVKSSCGQSYVVDHHLPQLLQGDYDMSFTLALAEKDISLIENLAKSVNSQLPIGSLLMRNYSGAVAAFGGSAPHLMVTLQTSRSEDQA